MRLGLGLRMGLATELMLGFGWRTDNRICISRPGTGNRILISAYYR